MKRHHLLFAALACGLFGLVSCHKATEAAPQKASVKVFPIQEQTVTDYGEWFAYLRGTENTNVMPRVTGFLVAQDYENGAHVKAGDVLFRIDDSLFKAAVEQAEANLAAANAALASAQAQLDKANLDVQRYEKLVKTAAVSEKELEDAQQKAKADQAQVDSCKASIEQSQAALEKARINLDYTVIHAPYDGIVGAAAVSIGDLVSPTTVLANITAVDPIYVDFAINGDNLLENIRKYGAGTPEQLAKIDIKLHLEDGSTYAHTGHLLAADSKLSDNGMLNMEGTIPNPENILRDGMATRVSIATDEHDALLVPQGAIRTVLRDSFIIILDRDNAPHMLPVTQGATYTVEVREANGYVSEQPMVAITDHSVPLADVFRKYGYEKATDVPVVSDPDTAVAASNLSASNSRLPKGAKPVTMKPEPFTFKPELPAGLKAVLDRKPLNPNAKATLPPFPVKVFPLVQQDVDEQQEWFGSLRGVDETDILPQVSGFILKCHFADGSMVKKGDVLYTIDPSTYKAQRDEAAANLDAAQANKREAEATLAMKQNDLDRYQKLAKVSPGAVSDKTVTDAQTAVLTAEASLQTAVAGIAQAQAALHQAEINLGYTTITAPFDGRIGISAVSEGDLVSASDTQPLVTLSSVDPIRVDFMVSGLGALQGITHYARGADMSERPPFALVFDDGTVFSEPGHVITGDNALNKSTGTLQIIGQVANPKGLLRSGMTVRVRAGTNPVKGAFLVPFRAPLLLNGKHLLVLLSEDDTPLLLPVSTGATVNITTKNADGTDVVQPMQIIDVDRDTVTALVLAKTQEPSLEALVFKSEGVDSWQALLAKNGGPADAPDARAQVLKAAGAADELDLIAKAHGYASLMEMGLKNSGFSDLSKVRVVVEGTMAAAQTYQANMAACAPVNKLTPTPFKYTPTKTVTPSITAESKPGEED